MKEGWKYVSLGECCDVLNGLWKGKKEPFVHVGVIRNANFTKEFTLDFSNVEYLDVEERQYAKRKLKKGDLIVEKSGGSEKWPVGRAVLFLKDDGEFSFSNFTSVLRIKDDIDITPEYLFNYLFFVYMRGDTRNMQKATTGIHNIEFDKYLSIQIPLSPLPEQQRIVEYLDSTFAEINALKAKAAEEVANAKAMFDAALREEMMPKEGWEEKTVGQTCQLKSGNSSANNSSIGELPFVKVGDLNLAENIEGIVTSSRFVNREENSKAIFPRGTTIFPKRGGAILTNKKRLTKVEICCDLNIMGVIPGDNMLPEYLYYFFLNTDLRELYDGASIPQINNCNISPLTIFYPPLSTQQRIVARLDTLRTLVTSLEQKYAKIATECDALKQAILRETFE